MMSSTFIHCDGLPVKRGSLLGMSVVGIASLLRRVPPGLPSLVPQSPDGSRGSSGRRCAMVLSLLFTATGTFYVLLLAADSIEL
jgi:hypothetical protein